LLKNDTRATCWRWQGAIDKNGYAIVRVGKKVRCGHDVTWEIHNGRAIRPPGATAGPHLPEYVVHPAAPFGAGDLRREQAARLAVSKPGVSLSGRSCDDAGEHVPAAWTEIP
jgi:hypothetical protein